MQELSHSQFLDLLTQRGIVISVKDGRLQISAPAGAVDTQLRAELVRRKPDLLGTFRDADVFLRPDPLVPMERDGGIPQTDAQQGLWLIDHFDPGNVAYNIPEAYLIEGAVEIEILQKAVDALLARHETLRTYFYEEEGELLQAVSSDARTTAGFTDLSMIDEGERDERMRKLIREQAREPFDLSQPPLVRFHLFRLAEQRHAIFFNIHHIIADGRSLIILQRELALLYQAAAGKETPQLPELRVQYPDYAIWASKYLASGAMAAQIEYWKAKLAGAPAYLELPSSRPYPEQRTAWGATIPVVISTSLRDALSEVGRQESATMFMTLLAAFAVLLYRHSGEEDLCIGSPFTHRNQVETEPLIGLFVNMLVFRCQLAGQPRFREVLRRVRTTALEAYEHSDLPFQELVRALKPDPRLRRSPLFQVMFGFDSDSGGGPDRLVQIDTNPGTARFDLTLQLNENPKGITGSFEYCTDLFDASSIEQLAAHFVSVVEEVTRHPDQPISSSQLVAKNEPEPAVSERAAISDRSTVASSRIGTLARRLLQRSQKH
jgi:hypothetical protein